MKLIVAIVLFASQFASFGQAVTTEASALSLPMLSHLVLISLGGWYNVVSEEVNLQALEIKKSLTL